MRRFLAVNNDTLDPVLKEGLDPAQNGAFNPIETQLPQQVFVRHGVKCF